MELRAGSAGLYIDMPFPRDSKPSEEPTVLCLDGILNGRATAVDG